MKLPPARPAAALPGARAPSFAAPEFRRALGMFATGVTVVTARDANGACVGLTANSFNSVSVVPPLVLWSLSQRAGSLPAFQRGSTKRSLLPSAASSSAWRERSGAII